VFGTGPTSWTLLRIRASASRSLFGVKKKSSSDLVGFLGTPQTSSLVHSTPSDVYVLAIQGLISACLAFIV